MKSCPRYEDNLFGPHSRLLSGHRYDVGGDAWEGRGGLFSFSPPCHLIRKVLFSQPLIFSYEHIHFRWQNSHKNMTLAQFLMLFQSFKDSDFTIFLGDVRPPYSLTVIAHVWTCSTVPDKPVNCWAQAICHSFPGLLLVTSKVQGEASAGGKECNLSKECCMTGSDGMTEERNSAPSFALWIYSTYINSTVALKLVRDQAGGRGTPPPSPPSPPQQWQW